MSKKYSNEQKRKVVSLYKKGRKASDICKEYGVSKTSMYDWIKDYQCVKMGDGTRISAKDYYDLRKSYQKLKTDYNILRECNCTVNSSLSNKLETIAALDGKYTIHALCRVLGVRRSTYYHYKLRRPEQTEIEKQDLILKPVIKEIFEQTKGRIGSKKIRYLIKKRGISTSAKRVRRLMKEMNLVCRPKRKGIRYNFSRSSKNCVNLLERNFDQTEPNKVWVSDITYIRVNRKAYYLCVMIDLFSRKVIGYKVNDIQEGSLVMETFMDAYKSRNPKGGLILHSDQGKQYKTNEFRTLIREKGFESSFSKPGCPYDNAVAESFFRMFKQEEANHIYYKISDDLMVSINEYINFFNDERPHAKLGNLTPNEKERNYYNCLEKGQAV